MYTYIYFIYMYIYMYINMYIYRYPYVQMYMYINIWTYIDRYHTCIHKISFQLHMGFVLPIYTKICIYTHSYKCIFT